MDDAKTLSNAVSRVSSVYVFQTHGWLAAAEPHQETRHRMADHPLRYLHKKSRMDKWKKKSKQMEQSFSWAFGGFVSCTSGR